MNKNENGKITKGKSDLGGENGPKESLQDSQPLRNERIFGTDPGCPATHVSSEQTVMAVAACWEKDGEVRPKSSSRMRENENHTVTLGNNYLDREQEREDEDILQANGTHRGHNESSPRTKFGKISVASANMPTEVISDVDGSSKKEQQKRAYDFRISAPPANAYCRLVARHPLIVCLTLLVINVSLGPLAIAIRGAPDMSDPKVGIEARGTVEAQAEHTFRVLRDLQKNTAGCEALKCDEGDKVGDCSITFSIHETQCPDKEYQKHIVRRRVEEMEPHYSFHRSSITSPWDTKPSAENEGSSTSFPRASSTDPLTRIFKKPTRMLPVEEEEEEEGGEKTRMLLQTSTKRCPGWTHGKQRLVEFEDTWSRYDLNKGSVGFGYKLGNEEGDFLEPKNLKSMFEIGKSLTSDTKFRDTFCLKNDSSCCPPESLASFASFVAGKEETSDITQADADKARKLISDCHKFRKNIIAASTYWMMGMIESVPASRTQLDGSQSADEAMFLARINKELNEVDGQECKDRYMELAGLYEYLLVEDWEPGETIKSTNSFFPVIPIDEHEGNLFDLFYNILLPKMDQGELRVNAIDMENPKGRFGVFDVDIKFEFRFALMSFLIIFCIMLFHNGSFAITFMGFGQIFISLSLTYFIYQIVFWCPHFSFMNLVCLFILIGIGVDDIFIYYDTWCQSFHVLDKDTPLENRIQWTLERAGAAMFMTTITTSAAFLTNVVSSVTCVKLFAIFSSLAIMCDYFLMMTMLPSIVVLSEGMCSVKRAPNFKLFPLKEGGPRKIDLFFATTFVDLILKVRYPLILIMTAWGFFSFWEALRIPNPNTDDLPLWVSDHPLEVWSSDHRPYYSGTTPKGDGMMVHINMGYKEEDNGHYLNPLIEGRGTVQFVETNFSTKAAQNFYLDVCEQSKQVSWVNPKAREANSVQEIEFDILCWPLAFRKWQQGADSPLKCKSYPVVEMDFNECLFDYLDDTNRWDVENFYFDMETKKMISMHLHIKSSKEWRAVYNYMEEVYELISSWTLEVIGKAPPELTEVNWNSAFRYFALQKNLSVGAQISSLISLVFALLAILMMTRRLDASILSVLAIFLILACVVANMKWQDWTIAINEAAIFSVAVGFSVDFVCHIAYAYCHAIYSPSVQMNEREFRLRFALGTVGISISAGAVTTLIGGSAMIFSRVLFYNRFGVYLVCTMFWSWLYAFFYFVSLLSVFGPQNMSTSNHRSILSLLQSLFTRFRDKNKKKYPPEDTKVVQQGSN